MNGIRTVITIAAKASTNDHATAARYGRRNPRSRLKIPIYFIKDSKEGLPSAASVGPGPRTPPPPYGYRCLCRRCLWLCFLCFLGFLGFCWVVGLSPALAGT